MKHTYIIAFMAVGLFISQAYADTNNTKIANNIDSQAKYQKLLTDALETLDIDLKKNKTENNMSIANDYNSIGFFYSKTGQNQNALPYYLKAVKIVENQKKQYLQKRTTYYNNLATIYEELNKLPEALEYYSKALSIYKDKLPADHPYTATTSCDIGSIHEKMGHKDKALEFQLEALEIRKKSLAPSNHPHTIYSYQKVASLYEEKGAYKEVLLYGRELLGLLDKNDKNTTIALKKKLDSIESKMLEKKVAKSKK